MHCLPLDPLQLPYPLPNILAAGIKPLALQQRIEDPEIGLRIHARAGAEPPPAVVAGEIAVDEVFHKIALAHAPVEQEVLGEERGDGHAGAVVHVAGCVELAHGGVDERVAGAALGPGVEQLLGILPFDVGVFRFEGFVHAGDN